MEWETHKIRRKKTFGDDDDEDSLRINREKTVNKHANNVWDIL